MEIAGLGGHCSEVHYSSYVLGNSDMHSYAHTMWMSCSTHFYMVLSGEISTIFSTLGCMTWIFLFLGLYYNNSLNPETLPYGKG